MKMRKEHLLMLLALAAIALLVYFRCGNHHDRFKGKLGVPPGGACQPDMEECYSGYACLNGTCQQVASPNCSRDGTC